MIYMGQLFNSLKIVGFFTALIILSSCGHENPARLTQFDLLENSAKAKPLRQTNGRLQTTNIQIEYPQFGKHPFSQLMGHLLMLDTTGVYCIGQKSLEIKYQVRWATKNVLSLSQEVVVDGSMSQGKRKTTIEHLYTLLNDTIYKLELEGSPTLLQEIQLALKKRTAPYCSPPKIEEVFPLIHRGHLEVTPHYGSALCDTTFRRHRIQRKDLRLIGNQVFLVLKS
jgi:hypothetical protein